MKIYYHKIIASASNITFDDVEHLANLAGIPLNLFKSFQAKSGTQGYIWKSPDGTDTESFRISIPVNAAYGSITLNGSFFNMYPDFPVHLFYEWIISKQGNMKLSDITFEDDEQALDISEIKNMCSRDNYQDFMTGSSVTSRKRKKSDHPDSLNRGGIPDVHGNHDLIHLGDISSPLSCKAYVMRTGNIKFELTVNDAKHNAAIIKAYSPESIKDWEKLAKQALVDCVNFVKPSSKRAKRPVQVDSWQRFLGSEVKPIKWKDHSPEQDIATLSFDQSVSRLIGQLQNVCHRHQIHDEVIADIHQLQARLIDAFNNVQALAGAF